MASFQLIPLTFSYVRKQIFRRRLKNSKVYWQDAEYLRFWWQDVKNLSTSWKDVADLLSSISCWRDVEN